jgi:hypothetical protein
MLEKSVTLCEVFMAFTHHWQYPLMSRLTRPPFAEFTVRGPWYLSMKMYLRVSRESPQLYHERRLEGFGLNIIPPGRTSALQKRR